MRNKLLFVFLTLTLIVAGQNNYQKVTLTFEQAVDFGLQYNMTLKNAQLEQRKARWKIWETTAIGLPQVNASGQLQYYTDLPTQLMPDFLSPMVYMVNIKDFGLHPLKPLDTNMRKFPVKFGSDYNISLGITISQLIFNAEWLVGLQAAKALNLIAQQSYDKAKIEVKAAIKQAYFLVLLTTESLAILQKNLENIDQIVLSTQQMAKLGITDQTQAEQLELLKLNISNQINTVKRQKELALYMLKFQLGLDPYDTLILSSNIEDLKQTIFVEIPQLNVANNIDYQLLQTQTNTKHLAVRQYQAKFLPSVAGFYTYSQNAPVDNLSDLKNKENWRPTSLFGIKVDIPIFSSGQRIAALTQQKIEYEKSLNQQHIFEQQLNIQYQQLLFDYQNSLSNVVSQEKNKNLSEKIYQNTLLKYSQGAASSTDLAQTQNQFLQAQANYYQALLQLFNAKINLEKLLNL